MKLGEPDFEATDATNEHSDLLSTTDKPDAITELVERHRARYEAYERFKENIRVSEGGEISTKIFYEDGRVDTIQGHLDIGETEIVSIDLERESPIKFAPPQYNVFFHRYVEKPHEKPKEAILFDLRALDDDAEAELAAKTESDTQEKIIQDLQNMLRDIGLPNIPVKKYALRLLMESQDIEKEIARNRADEIIPIYREWEIKRLLSEPGDANTDLNAITQIRQRLYNQLTKLLEEAGMSPEKRTEYLFEGLYDIDHIAGIPVLNDTNGNTYVAVDYRYGGYDEHNPVGTDFTDTLEHRSSSEIHDILEQAEAHGYQTHHETSGVSRGTHYHWDWYGIQIAGYDHKNPEANLPKVLEILKAVGIKPMEAVNNAGSHEFDDMYMRRTG